MEAVLLDDDGVELVCVLLLVFVELELEVVLVVRIEPDIIVELAPVLTDDAFGGGICEAKDDLRPCMDRGGAIVNCDRE